MRRPFAELSPLLAGFVLTMSTGCYHMYSQPYGYSSGVPMGATYPGTMQYGAPIQTLTPGQPYVPGSTYQAVPGGTPTYQGGLQPIPENNAPTYSNPTSPTTPTTPNTTPNPNPVTPNPYFPNTYNAPTGLKSIQPTAFQEPAPLSPPSAALREVRSIPVDSLPQMNAAQSVPTASAALPAQPAAVAAPTPTAALMPLGTGNATPAPVSSGSPPPAADAFALPVMAPAAAAPTSPASPAASAPAVPDQFALPSAEPASAESLLGVEAKKVVTAGLETFGHDERFQWLRGVVTKDPQNGSWSIVYNDHPAEDDRWAGHLSLAPSPHLENLKDGDVVEVHGQIDGVVLDRLGKPVYVVASVKKPFSQAK